MTTVLKKIQNATDTGGEKLERFAKVAGMSSEEFSKAFKEDAAQGLHTFVQGLENSSKKGENLTAILSDLGITGIRESDTLLRLAGNSELLSDSLGMAKTAWEENTALTNEAAQRYETTASKIAVFKNKLKDVGITIGDIIVPILTDLISKAEPLIQAFSNMSAETQTMIVAFAAVAAAIGPVIVVIGSVVSSFGTITAALGGVIASLGAAGGVTGALGAAFAALTGPIGIAIAAFAGISTALVLLWKNNEDFREAVSGIWEGIKGVIVGAVQIIQGIISSFIAFMAGDWSALWEGVKAITSGAMTAISNVVSLAFNLIKATIVAVLTAIQPIVSTAWEVIKTTFKLALEVIKLTVNLAFAAIKGFIKFAMDGIKLVVSTVWSAIKLVFTTTLNVIKTVVTTVFNAIKTVITTVLNGIKSVTTSVWNGIKIIFTTTLNAIKSVVSTSFNAMKSTISGVMDGIKNVVTSIWNAISSVSSTIVTGMKNTIVNIFNGFKTAVATAMSGVKTAIVTGWNNAVSYLKGISLVQIGKDVIQGFINGIGSMFGAVQRKISEIANLVPSKIKKILGIASPSKVTTKLGKWTGEGFANGISSQSGNVSKSATKVANEASKAFNNAMQKLDLQLKAGTVSTGSYTKQMNALKSQHKGVTNATQKIDAKVAAANTKQAKEQQKKRQEEMTKLTKRFNTQVQKLDLNLKAGKINTTQYQNSLESMKKEYAKVPNAIAKVDAKIKTQKDKDLKEQFKQDKAYYTAKTKDANVSMQDELNILNTLAKSYKKNSEERVYFENLAKQKKQAIVAEKKKIDEDYLAKVTEVNEKLAESEKKLTEEYQKAVDDRAKSLYSFAGLFDEVSANQEITGDKLLSNLQGQVDMFQEWQASLTQLSGRGISEDLLKELQELGPKSAGEIAALNSLTDEQLTQYEALWKEKSALARQQAIAELEGMRLDTAEQIAQLREEAKAQLDVYRNEWETQMKKVTKSATNMAKLMPQTGRDAVQGLIDGMNAKKAELQAVAAEIANIVSSTTAKQLDIHSPSRVMKKLGVFTNDGFIEGLKESFARLKYTVAESYGSLSTVSENAMRQPSMMSSMQTSTYDYSKNPSYVVNVTNASDAQIARIVRREFEAMAFRG